MINILKKRIISVLLTLSVLSGSSLFAFAQDDKTGVDEIISANDLVMDPSDDVSLDELTTDEEDDYIPRYVEDEVIIMLADTPETENLQLYSVYSDDYQTLNREATEKANVSRSTYALNSATETVTVAGSTNVIEDILDLDIEITEMKMLNPQSEAERVNTASASRSATATNTNEKVYTVNEENNNMFSIKFENSSVTDVIAALNDNSMIAIVEPNYIGEFLATPNDAYYDTQYAIEQIKADEAWNITTGSSNVVVGVIDSGIDGTHPDLVDNLWHNPYYSDRIGCYMCGRFDDEYGYNFTGGGTTDGYPCGGTPTDPLGHGTHVAGIIGAKGNNSKGVCGVNWNVSLAWLGVYDEEVGMTVSGAITALNYADNHDILITNNSYSFKEHSVLFENAISDYDGLFVAAAGNDKLNIDETPIYPQCFDCPNIITVAATDSSGNLAEFNNPNEPGSNYGIRSVDVAAPGVSIMNTIVGGSYGNKTGTSMAAPHVAGIAALIKATNPTFTPLQIKAVICGTVQQLNKQLNVGYDGGAVDAKAAVEVTSDMLKSISYNDNYSGAPAPFVDYIVSGKVIIDQPLVPVRDGYIFNGWYTSPTGGVLFDFDTPITTNTTLYAQWIYAEENTYGYEFPDYYFREYILSVLNNKHSSIKRTPTSPIAKIDETYMSRITELSCERKKIRDLSGISYFSGLLTLECQYNLISELDLSELASLTTLNCSYNKLTELDLSGLENLDNIDCSFNSITSINLNDTIKLTELECRYNYLTSIDLTNCDELTTVYLYFNSLTSLNLSNLKKLTTAGCTYNNLTSLTLGDLPALEELYCSYNDLTVLSLSGLPDLYYLNCNNNNLTSLDLSRSPQLKYLYCKYNNLNNLNVSALFGLEEVECSYNNLTTLSFEMAPKKLVCNNNNLVSLKLNDQSKLKHLLCENNSLQLLDLRETFELNSSEVFGDFDGVSVINNDFCDENDILGVELWGEAHPRIAFSPQSVWENNPFNDIFIETNGYKAVEYMVEHSYMLGTSSTSFSPNDTVSRRQMVVVMYVMAGAPDVSNLSIPFTDVASNDYSHNAVKWAYNNGIVGGTSATTFSPHDPVNRKSAAVMMNKFAQYNNWTLPVIREYMDFADESSISSWAKESVQLVYNAGIMNYSSSSANNYYFAPNQNLTRGELAVILRKFEVMKLYL